MASPAAALDDRGVCGGDAYARRAGQCVDRVRRRRSSASTRGSSLHRNAAHARRARTGADADRRDPVRTVACGKGGRVGEEAAVPATRLGPDVEKGQHRAADAMAAPWRTVAFILHVIASTLALVVVIVFATGGLRFRLGAFLISATQPGRIALQAAIVWLVATLASTRRQRGFVMVPILAVMLASWLDSHPRRVGDGDEYMAMALNMSHGLPPALSRDEWVTRREELRNTAGFEESNLVPPLPGINGRQDFHHFWLYSMLAAPLVATARLAG